MATPQSASDLFDNLMPAAIAKSPEEANKVGAIYVFKVTGDGGGEWTVDLKASPPSITKGDSGNGQCIITVAHTDFLAMLANPALGMQLFMQGKLAVKGDPMLAMKLQNLFKLA